jgi:cell division protein FtsX
MEDKAEGSVRRLQRINRYLMIGAIALAITIVFLAMFVIIDYA